jgi:hypothetical protein
MKNSWKWLLGISAGILLLYGLMIVSGFFMPYGGYMLNSGGYAWGMPMMSGRFAAPFHPFWGSGMFIFMPILTLALLVLIGLGIAALVKTLRTQAPKQQ